MYRQIFEILSMSAKKTADAALAVAEEALNKVYVMQRGNPALLFAVVIVLGYIFFVNYYVVGKPDKSQYILEMYHNKNIRVGVVALIILGMSGVFGIGFSHLATILAFAYVTSYVTLRDIKEGMENNNFKDKSNFSMELSSDQMKRLTDKLMNATSKLYTNKSKMNEDDEQDVENMTDFPESRSGQRCTPCAKGSRKSFNPRPYVPDSPLMGIGNDKLPPMGVDFLSAPSGVFTQSQIGYQLGFS